MKAKLLFFITVNFLALTAFSKEQEANLLRCVLTEIQGSRKVETRGVILATSQALSTQTEVLGLIPMASFKGEDVRGAVYLFPKSSDGKTRSLLQIYRNGEILSQNTFFVEELNSLELVRASFDSVFGDEVYLGCKNF